MCFHFHISDYYLVALLMLSKTPYTVDSLASRMIDGNDLAQMFGDVEDQVKRQKYKAYKLED